MIIKNPFLNAVLAAAYIVLVVTVISLFVDREVEAGNVVLLIPMAMLSLFVLSAAVMTYLFLFQPFALWSDGKRPEAVAFFLKTVGTFAVITAGVLLALAYLL